MATTGTAVQAAQVKPQRPAIKRRKKKTSGRKK